MDHGKFPNCSYMYFQMVLYQLIRLFDTFSSYPNVMSKVLVSCKYCLHDSFIVLDTVFCYVDCYGPYWSIDNRLNKSLFPK